MLYKNRMENTTEEYRRMEIMWQYEKQKRRHISRNLRQAIPLCIIKSV